MGVDVGNVQVLKLSATNNGSNNHNHADWADAKLTPKTQTVDISAIAESIMTLSLI